MSEVAEVVKAARKPRQVKPVTKEVNFSVEIPNPFLEENDKLKADNAGLIKELMQSHADWRYATKAFGQHDWMSRRFEALCDVLHKHGIEVSRDPSK